VIFTSDWVSANHERWVETLGHLRGRVAHIAELGSFEGRSALWFLENILETPGSTMWCFDPWRDSQAVEERFDANTRVAREEGRLKKVKGAGAWDLVKLPAAYFDAVYVDGDHRAFECLTDAVVAWRMLKVGGILVFDDYGIGSPYEEGHGPAVGIDAFLMAARGRFDTLTKQYQVIVQKVRA
jgi:predicted O-methyltransferase YrrM